MASSRTERRVNLWRVAPRVKPAAARERGKTSSLEEIICILEAEHSAGRAKVLLSAGGGLYDEESEEAPDPKNQIYIADIKRHPDGSAVTLLVNRGDPNAAYPAFVNVVTDGVRVSHPQPPEAQGWSAHLCISTEIKSGVHRACFERMTRVSSSLTMAAIDRIIDRALEKNPTYTYPASKIVGGKPRIEHRPYRPTLEVERIPSESLIEDLKKGELSSITLTRPVTAYSGLDAKQTILRQEHKLVIHTAKVEPKLLEKLVQNISVFAKEKDFQKITFHLDKLPGGMTNQPTIDVDEENALETLYVRAQRLTGFPAFLESAYEKVYSPIEEKMLQIVNEKEG